MLRMLRFMWELTLVWVWFALISCVFLLLAGCDALVSDNPVCEYDCTSTQSLSRQVY